MRKLVASLLVAAFAVSIVIFSTGMNGSDNAERKAVERAVLDYCEAAYDMRPELFERSVHPEVHKFGFHRRSAEQEYRKIPMTYSQLLELAKVWNRDGKFGSDAPKKVEVYDVLDKIASAKLIGAWGIDYMHLAKYDGKWKIVQVLWQSHPQPTD